MADLNFEKEITALLIIDPYNDFISEGGKLWDRNKSVLAHVWSNGKRAPRINAHEQRADERGQDRRNHGGARGDSRC